jgi:hypothetical protein
VHGFPIIKDHVVRFDPSATLDLQSGLSFAHTSDEGQEARNQSHAARPATSTTIRHKGADPVAVCAHSKQGT